MASDRAKEKPELEDPRPSCWGTLQLPGEIWKILIFLFDFESHYKLFCFQKRQAVSCFAFCCLTELNRDLEREVRIEAWFLVYRYTPSDYSSVIKYQFWSDGVFVYLFISASVHFMNTRRSWICWTVKWIHRTVRTMKLIMLAQILN